MSTLLTTTSAGCASVELFLLAQGGPSFVHRETSNARSSSVLSSRKWSLKERICTSKKACFRTGFSSTTADMSGTETISCPMAGRCSMDRRDNELSLEKRFCHLQMRLKDDSCSLEYFCDDKRQRRKYSSEHERKRHLPVIIASLGNANITAGSQ